MSKKRTIGKKKKYKNIPEGIAYVHSTFNNTIVTVSAKDGTVICWKSSGTQGFKGTKKGTPFAAQVAAEACGEEAKKHGIKKVEVKVKGLGSGREAAIRSLQAVGIEIESISDKTPIPHNGPRPPKERRM